MTDQQENYPMHIIFLEQNTQIYTKGARRRIASDRKVLRKSR